MNGKYPFAAQPPTHRPMPFGQKQPSPAALMEQHVNQQIANLAGRIKVIEERIDSLRSHYELVDNTVIEKHKSVVSEIRELQSSMRSLRSDIDGVKDFTERIAKRLEALASKEQVKVLERYVDAWQPLKYITRSELKDTMISILKNLGFKIK